jgi:2-haloacid dehalogenase
MGAANSLKRPEAVAFDVVETLMSLEPLRERMVEIGLAPHALETWFAHTLRDGIALAATGDYAPFDQVAAAALRAVSGHRIGDGAVRHVLAGFAELPAHPDVVPAMRRLAAAGIPLACLTNGGAQITTGFVERCGLLPFIQRVITVEEVRRWKPPATIYNHAATTLGVPPGRLTLVAAHAWDCHGAKRAGLTTAWISRLEGRYPPIFTAPDVRGADLVEVADRLLALPVALGQ